MVCYDVIRQAHVLQRLQSHPDHARQKEEGESTGLLVAVILVVLRRLRHSLDSHPARMTPGLVDQEGNSGSGLKVVELDRIERKLVIHWDSASQTMVYTADIAAGLDLLPRNGHKKLAIGTVDSRQKAG